MKKRFAVFWGVLALLLIFIFFYLPGLSRYQELHLEEEKISKELAGIEEQISKLKEEKELLQKDKDYLEKVIHEELGLVRPGEMVYKLIPAEKKSPSADPQ